jgi:cytidine deaminase
LQALAAAIAGGAKPRSMSEIAVYATGFEVLSPCGACRQVMSELLSEHAVVHSHSSGGEASSWSIGELFPEPFVLE